MTFPSLIENKIPGQPSDLWFDDCLSRYDQLLEMPLPPHFLISSNEESTFSGMDVMAWYSPWFMHTQRTYGIHLLDAGIVQFADQLATTFNHINSAAISKASAVLWATYCLYCHELCHSWIEQLIGYYHQNQYRNSFRFYQDEEAVCNTAVFGMQHDLYDNLDRFYPAASGNLQCTINELKKLVLKNKQQMQNALESVMQNQPDGYKDYIPIDQSPLKHTIFLAKLFDLAKSKYSCNAEKIDKALQAITDARSFAKLPSHYIHSPEWINPCCLRQEEISQDTINNPKTIQVFNKNKYKAYVFNKVCFIDSIGDAKLERDDRSGGVLWLLKPEIKDNEMKIEKIDIDTVFQAKTDYPLPSDVIKIINDHLNSCKDIFSCQEVLFKAGYKDWAKA